MLSELLENALKGPSQNSYKIIFYLCVLPISSNQKYAIMKERIFVKHKLSKKVIHKQIITPVL